jgi:coproporphyrinogen III oxidase
MSAVKQKYVWVCRTGDELTAVFSTEEMAREFCDMQNRAAEATQQSMREMGFKNYGRAYFTFIRKELKRGLD